MATVALMVTSLHDDLALGDYAMEQDHLPLPVHDLRSKIKVPRLFTSRKER